MKAKIITSGALALCLGFIMAGQGRPNIVFIMSDDLNDWAGGFSGLSRLNVI